MLKIRLLVCATCAILTSCATDNAPQPAPIGTQEPVTTTPENFAPCTVEELRDVTHDTLYLVEEGEFDGMTLRPRTTGRGEAGWTSFMITDNTLVLAFALCTSVECASASPISEADVDVVGFTPPLDYCEKTSDITVYRSAPPDTTESVIVHINHSEWPILHITSTTEPRYKFWGAMDPLE